jgi:hypothetical protein
MKKSESVPGLFMLGTSNPAFNCQPKKATLSFQLSGPVDLAPNKDSTSAKGIEIVELMKKPSWRWTAIPALPKEPEPVDRVPKNMRVPRLPPAWLKHDKQSLRFYGYFQEHVVERWDENCRYRSVVFTYFLEDGTLSCTEPKVENSGLMQGPLLKRHHAPNADGTGLINPLDFRIGEQLFLYGVAYQITGADRFTRWFFEEMGWELPDDEGQPEDQWRKSYTFLKTAEKGGLPVSKSSAEAKTLTKFQVGQPPADRKLIQFLQCDRKVLRFKGYWDDPTMYGNRFYFTIHYYLADNTVEINEAHARNSGRDAYPIFFKRGQMQKEFKTNCYPGMLEPEPDYYLPKDMLVGGTINLYRRTIYIYDCDEFTQRFYQEYMGIDQQANRIDVADPPKTHQTLTPPPHNGIGSEEDSLENCLRIQPKPAKQDLARLMTLSGEVLRFEARMNNGEPEDENRRFIIGWFPADNHIACWELPVRNSGHMAGKFAEKLRRKNPETGVYFTLYDLAIGKTVWLASQPLLVLRADEHTLCYVERNTDEFPSADPRYCVSLLAPLVGSAELQDERGIEPDHLTQLALANGCGIIDHDVITLLRTFSMSPEGGTPLISGPRILQALSELGY